MSEAKFDPGQIVITSAARDIFDGDFVVACLERHVQGDWGDLDPEDAKINDAGLKEHPYQRLHSNYVHSGGLGRLWIITDHDLSVTTVLLPEDY